MRFSSALLLLLSSTAIAQQWQIAPQTCIVTQENVPCILKLIISTDMPTNETSCVFRSDVKTPLKCLGSLEAEQQIHLTLELTQPIQIDVRTTNGQLLASQAIDYATYKPVTTRRRRGLGWNLL